MEIRNGVFERLQTVKGNSSWSDALEQLMNKAGIAVSDNLPEQPDTTASDNPVMESASSD